MFCFVFYPLALISLLSHSPSTPTGKIRKSHFVRAWSFDVINLNSMINEQIILWYTSTDPGLLKIAKHTLVTHLPLTFLPSRSPEFISITPASSKSSRDRFLHFWDSMDRLPWRDSFLSESSNQSSLENTAYNIKSNILWIYKPQKTRSTTKLKPNWMNCFLNAFPVFLA